MSTAQKVLQKLSGYSMHGRGPEYRSRSPFRAESDDPSFSLLIEDDEHGTWLDHVTNRGGSLYELAEHFGIETPKRVQVESSKRPYTSMADYAAFKGIPVEALQEAKWREVLYMDRPAIEFNTAGGRRWRFLDGNKPKFISEKGYKACWYGLVRAVHLAKETQQPLVICNGEPSVIVAQHFGVAACAITGGESKNIAPELLHELTETWKGEIVIAMDCDTAGNTGASKYAEALTAVGAKFKIVDLMLSSGGDIADFCKLHTTDTVKALNALGAVKVKAQPVNVDDKTLKQVLAELTAATKEDESLDELLARAQKEIDRLALIAKGAGVVSAKSLVDELHKEFEEAIKRKGQVPGFRSGMPSLDVLAGGWQKGRLYVFLAATGVGKSTVTSSIVYPFIRQGRGLIIPTETTAKVWLNKMAAYRAGVTTDAIEDGRVAQDKLSALAGAWGTLESDNVNFLQEKSPTPAQIIANVRANAYDWIVIDSLSNLNDPTARAIFDNVSSAADLAAELSVMGICVIATAQVGRNLEGRKIRKPEINDGKGSGRIEENADVVFGLYRHDLEVLRGQAEAMPDVYQEGTINIECLKHRHRGASEGRNVQPLFIGGMGIYENGATK